MSAELASVAFQRFAEALNHSRSSRKLRAAVADDVELERHDPGPRDSDTPGTLAETFAGIDAVERWIHRMPPVITFSLASPVGPAPDSMDTWRVRYDYVINNADFRNSGWWLARLARDGKIAWLAHRPFVLPDAPEVDAGEHAEHHRAEHGHHHGHAHHEHGGPAGEQDEPAE